MYYAFIMAGGSGTRLWPLSRQAHPKQTLRLVGERSLFQQAVDRLAPLFPYERILVGTRREYIGLLQQQVPELSAANYILEPEGRGTAPAIGLAAVHLHQRDPEAVMAVLTADHYIRDTARFLLILSAADAVAQNGALVTLGILPSTPSAGYGYIKQGQSLDCVEGFSVYQVDKFIEKPDQATADSMFASSEYAWNSGMFIWKVSVILDEFKRQMPEFYEQLTQLETTIGTPDYETTLQRIWPLAPVQTIDYGIMEGARFTAVIPVEFGWTDVGSWASLSELLPANQQGNIFTGPHMALDTQDTLVFSSKRLVATIGIKGMVIVDTEDALLVCPKEREQEVRRVVNLLKEEQYRRWL
jgi:mannose-1-phosphate guanylyltransferase